MLEAIASDPQNADAFCELALCRLNIEGKKKCALDPIERAIGLEPSAHHLAVKALVLNALDKEQQAIKFADQAIALDPDEPFHFYVKAAALAGQSRWQASETECRNALALDPDDGLVKNLLAIVLRMQGKKWETEVAVGQLLAEDPEDAWGACERWLGSLEQLGPQEGGGTLPRVAAARPPETSRRAAVYWNRSKRARRSTAPT